MRALFTFLIIIAQLVAALRQYEYVDIHVAFSACGWHYAQSALTAIRCVYTAQINANVNTILHVHCVHDRNASEPAMIISKLLKEKLYKFHPRVVVHRKDIVVPHFRDSVCASTKLFPEALIQDATIKTLNYLDCDTCMLGNPYDFMKVAKRFNVHQFAAFSPEESTWYRSGRSGPDFYGTSGINSGVAVFNVEKWKASKTYRNFLLNYSNTYAYPHRSPLGDQDVLNRYFAKYPEGMYVIPCQYNLRTDSCIGQVPKLIHGNRHSFTNNSIDRCAFASASLFLGWIRIQCERMSPRGENHTKITQKGIAKLAELHLRLLLPEKSIWVLGGGDSSETSCFMCWPPLSHIRANCQLQLSSNDSQNSRGFPIFFSYSANTQRG